MLRELKKLYQARILAPTGLYQLVRSFIHSGVNLMAMLRYAAKSYPDTDAIIDDHGHITYADLYRQTEQLSAALADEYAIAPRQKVAIICRNHAALIKSLFAVSQLGADIFLLNIEMSSGQLEQIVQRHHFALVIHDEEVLQAITLSGYMGQRIFSYHPSQPSVDAKCNEKKTPGKRTGRGLKAGNLVVLSGGTTGDFKTVARKQGVMRFINPLCSLLVNAELDKHRSVYIATPIYHGYGLATVFVSVLLGSRMCLLSRFDAAKACRLIEQQQIAAVTLVPIMLHRMVQYDTNALRCLSCIITGGAPISPSLVTETLDKLGPKLFNLYGTSEAGLSMLATPRDLAYAANTAGREIKGVQLKILNADNEEMNDGHVGRICIKNGWSAWRVANTWIESGDLGYRDKAGYYFLCGRTDDMIISGGENVYPITLEHVLLQYPAIKEAAVIGVSDAEFGQRLKAFVVAEAGSRLNTDEVLKWLAGKVARYQMPLSIEVMDDLPYTPVGKPDKRRLAELAPV